MNLSKQAQAGRYSRAGKARSRRAKARAAEWDGSPEHELQKSVQEYLELRGLLYIHIPNAALKTKAGAAYLKSLPDLLIFRRAGKYPRCLAVEIKVGKNDVDAGQRDMLKYFYCDVWEEYVHHNFDAIIKEIDRFVARCEREQKGWEEYLKLEEK